MNVKTRGDEAFLQWVERFCMVPFGSDRGHRVTQSDAEKSDLRQRYGVGPLLQDGSSIKATCGPFDALPSVSCHLATPST